MVSNISAQQCTHQNFLQGNPAHPINCISSICSHEAEGGDLTNYMISITFIIFNKTAALTEICSVICASVKKAPLKYHFDIA